ncbi:MAG: transketolase family protein [Verrucomicrobiae bacterium]|nr:transketolase family protein [Verrucomicrobiae bacterium]
MSKLGQTMAMGVSEAVEGYPAVLAPFGNTLVRIASENPRVVGLSADLAKYTDILPFARAHPDRFFNVGMAEQNLIGIAAGMARTGWVPFCTTYCVFATRRAYDFIAIGCAMSRTNVKIVAGLPGLTTGYGGTHQGIEDLALMRAIPHLTVIDPCDATELAQATRAIAEFDGPVYMRLLRGRVPVVLDPETHRFQIGKATLLRPGEDLGIISTGIMTPRALKAAEELESQGIRVSVLHVGTLKPFDREAVLSLLARVPAVVTAENHCVTGGLASAVADAAADEGMALRLRRVGIPDCFCECGSLPYLAQRYEMESGHIVAAGHAVLKQ